MELINKKSNSKINLVVCSVTVQANCLAVATFGWTDRDIVFLLDRFNLEGNTGDLEDKCWGNLSRFIEDTKYTVNPEKESMIQVTLIDSGYRTEEVYAFCKKYFQGVYPSKGMSSEEKFRVERSYTNAGAELYKINNNAYSGECLEAIDSCDTLGRKGDLLDLFICANAARDICGRE